MAAVDTLQPLDWANDAFVALDVPATAADKWSMFPQSQPFSIPPSLLSQAAVARHGQVTPPEERSPAIAADDARQSSIPVEQQLRNDLVWPQQAQHLSQQPQQTLREPIAKRRRTGRLSAANQSEAALVTPPQHDANPQPPKRKRGRPKSLPQIVDASNPDGFTLHVSSARQSHLEKNRVAAHKCRQRKKEYINSLESRARDFSTKNKAFKENVAMLREEVLSLKNEVLRHAGCGFWAVDEFLARCAGDLLGMEAPAQTSHNYNTAQDSPSFHTQHFADESPDGTHSHLGHPSDMSSPELDDEFGGLELLRDYEDDDMDDQL